jgi:signal peptidase I
MNIDFALILVLLTFFSGFVWLTDKFIFAPRRKSPGQTESQDEPLIVEYARSFFPIFLIVLILRSFIIEPFKIPSGSMIPTLLIGDFILVNKYDYGIRLPVLNTKIIDNGIPKRGDIVVFRYPENPSIPYIKRIVGLPGDKIVYYKKILYINGELMPQEIMGRYRSNGADKAMDGASHRRENLSGYEHDILVIPERFSQNLETIVPEGHYFVLGDNRDNSKDSRYWGFVPDDNLMGSAFLIWMNWRYRKIWDFGSWEAQWKRIGTMMQ